MVLALLYVIQRDICFWLNLSPTVLNVAGSNPINSKQRLANFLCSPSSEWVELGMIKALKREGLGAHHSPLVGECLRNSGPLFTPIDPTAIRLGDYLNLELITRPYLPHGVYGFQVDSMQLYWTLLRIGFIIKSFNSFNMLLYPMYFR